MATIHSPAQSLYLHRYLVAARLGGVDAKHNAGAFAATSATAQYKRNVAFGLAAVEAGALWLTGNAAVLHLMRAAGPEATQWAEFAATHVDAVAQVLLPALAGVDAAKVGPLRGHADQHLTQTLEFLNAHLETRTWLVGERLSAADVCVGLSLHHLFAAHVDEARRAALPHVTRWVLTVVHQPDVAAVVGAFKLHDGPAPAAAKGGKAEKEKGGDKKAEKPKAAEKPKEEKKADAGPAPKKAAAKEDDGDDDDEKPKKKDVNPLDLLPPSPFELDGFKRLYRNEADTRGKVLPVLWETLDAAGYSMWIADYQYNAENKKLFMTCNLVGGMYQRMEKCHKYALGVTHIYGTDNLQKILGVWIIRGTDFPQVFKDVDDTEYHTWTKIGWPPSDADKKRIGDLLACEPPMAAGEKLFETKVFV